MIRIILARHNPEKTKKSVFPAEVYNILQNGEEKRLYVNFTFSLPKSGGNVFP